MAGVSTSEVATTGTVASETANSTPYLRDARGRSPHAQADHGRVSAGQLRPVSGRTTPGVGCASGAVWRRFPGPAGEPRRAPLVSAAQHV